MDFFSILLKWPNIDSIFFTFIVKTINCGISTKKLMNIVHFGLKTYPFSGYDMLRSLFGNKFIMRKGNFSFISVSFIAGRVPSTHCSVLKVILTVCGK